MVPAIFTNFFIASAGAGGALIGLLFVAVSIAPENTIMEGAPVELAESLEKAQPAYSYQTGRRKSE